MLKAAAFEELRQRQQLGYTCHVAAVHHAGILGLSVVVAGDQAPDYTAAAVEMFLDGFVDAELPRMGNGALQRALDDVDAVRRDHRHCWNTALLVSMGVCGAARARSC